MIRGGAAKLREATQIAVELFAWWRAELRDLAQWALRQLPSRSTPEVLLRVSGERISVERRAAQSWTPVLAFTHDAAVGDLPELPPTLKGARAAIALDDSEFYFDDLQFPVGVVRHLASAVKLQLERLMPVPLTGLLTDHVVAATDRKQGRLRVRVVVAHRQRIEQLRDLAEKLGLTPVSAGAISADHALQFNLLRRRRDPVSWSLTPLDARLAKLAGAAAILLVAVIGSQWALERVQVNDGIGELHAQADKLRATRDRLTMQAEPLIDLTAVSNASSAPGLLATLSSAVPAPTWFSHVELITPAEGAATLQLTGEVTSRDDLVKALSAVPGMRGIEIGSAFSGEILGKDRVELTAQYLRPVGTGVSP